MFLPWRQLAPRDRFRRARRGPRAVIRPVSRHLALEALEGRLLPSLTVSRQVAFGGPGYERGAGIAVVATAAGHDVYVSGTSSDLQSEGLLVKYTVTPSGVVSKVWETAWPGLMYSDSFTSVAATPQGAYAAGYSDALPAEGVTVAFSPSGLAGWGSRTSPDPDTIPTTDHQQVNGLVPAVENGRTVLYATGYSRINPEIGPLRASLLFLTKLDAATGTVLWTRTDDDDYARTRGHAVTTLGGNVVVAGHTASGGTLRMYSPSGALLWSRTTDAGWFNAVTAGADGTIYAVGRAGPPETDAIDPTNPPVVDFLIEKWDATGRRVWSRSYDLDGGDNILSGVTLFGGQILAVGNSRSRFTAGGSDGVLLTLDPAEGNLVASSLWGGAGDDSFSGVVATATAVHVVGTTSSYGAGGSDGVYLVYAPSTEVNLALNTTGTGIPSPLESDRGWGGGSYPWEIVDGRTAYDWWTHGLAFTGGSSNWVEPAGPRQATIDLGGLVSFTKVVLWHHGEDHAPAAVRLEYWDGTAWREITYQRRFGREHVYGSGSGSSISDEYTFAAVTGSKVRYSFDNRGSNVLGAPNIHGWLYEFEVFGYDPFLVTNTNDCGPGSLRQALLAANAHPGRDTIRFAIGSRQKTIHLSSALPAITEAVVIDATTQPGYRGTPLIELSGGCAGAADGLTILAGGSVVRGLAIRHFAGAGIRLRSSGNTIGGSTIWAGNTIALNGGAGVKVDAGFGNLIRHNTLFANAGLEIDLGPDGVTANDPDDRDTGANGLLNFPVLESASTRGDGTVIRGKFLGAPNTTLTLDFFISPVVDDSGQGEGETFLGSITVTTDDSGVGFFKFTTERSIPVGRFISLTATDASNNTSEFSRAVSVKSPPQLTPAADQEARAQVATDFRLGSFTAAGGSGWRVEVDWGNGARTAFDVTTAGSLGVSPHTYAERGTYTVTVTVTNEDGVSDSQRFWVAVTPVPVKVEPPVPKPPLPEPVDPVPGAVPPGRDLVNATSAVAKRTATASAGEGSSRQDATPDRETNPARESPLPVPATPVPITATPSGGMSDPASRSVPDAPLPVPQGPSGGAVITAGGKEETRTEHRSTPVSPAAALALRVGSSLLESDDSVPVVEALGRGLASAGKVPGVLVASESERPCPDGQAGASVCDVPADEGRPRPSGLAVVGLVCAGLALAWGWWRGKKGA